MRRAHTGLLDNEFVIQLNFRSVAALHVEGKTYIKPIANVHLIVQVHSLTCGGSVQA